MRRLKILAGLLAMALLLCVPALAASGSLRIELTDDTGAPAEGVAAALWRVDGPKFSGAGVSEESLARERDAAENARILAAYAAEQDIPADAEGATDARGVLRFGDLAEGTYLVVCRGGQALTFPGFLVTIPLRVGGSVRYDVTSRPKAEPAAPVVTPTPEPTPEQPPVPTDALPEPSPAESLSPIDAGSLPQTGQSPLSVLLPGALALVLLALGIWELVHRRRAWPLLALALAAALGAGTVLWTYRSADRLAGETSEALLAELELRWSAPAAAAAAEAGEGEPASAPEEAQTDVAVELGEYALLGVLRIPELGLALPVMSEWSYPLLTAAPCRYSGSLAGGDLVILGHSYRSHFRGLWSIEPGAAVELTDAAGAVRCYTVAAVETVPGSDAAALAGDWPLTLFTCTADSAHRVLVRCEEAE